MSVARSILSSIPQQYMPTVQQVMADDHLWLVILVQKRANAICDWRRAEKGGRDVEIWNTNRAVEALDILIEDEQRKT